MLDIALKNHQQGRLANLFMTLEIMKEEAQVLDSDTLVTNPTCAEFEKLANLWLLVERDTKAIMVRAMKLVDDTMVVGKPDVKHNGFFH